MRQSLMIKTPGKLMVAGEYAVLEPYNHLLVMAVNRFVYTEIKDATSNVVTLKDFNLIDLDWKWENDQVTFTSNDKRLSFVRDALLTSLTYLREINIIPDPFSLTITSELDDKSSGLKYGLGSSAAVVTSLITAVLTKFLSKSPPPKLIFKLAAISHIKTQGNGSGADIAASTYGGVLHYTSFQAEWLMKEMQRQKNLNELVAKKWKYLHIERIQLPQNVQVCVGWTGKPASTGSLVNDIQALKVNQLEKYECFIRQSDQAVRKILHGVTENDCATFYTGINENRQALSQLGKDANVEIETDKLAKLSFLANEYGGAGKLSGAGGGDCGIAFIPRDVSCEQLHVAWEQAGIKPLSLNISLIGSEAIKLI